MKENPKAGPAGPEAPATLQSVLDRLAGMASLSETVRRDLRSAVTSYARLVDQNPSAIPLDLASIRQSLERMVPARAKISAKRWSNLRSALARAINASGLRPMLKTAHIEPDEDWSRLLATADQRTRNALSRFARWAFLHQIGPAAVNDETIERFVAQLDQASLVRKLHNIAGTVARAWNALGGLHPDARLQRVRVPRTRPEPIRTPWERLPASFRQDVEGYLEWAAVPDPLADGARPRALATLSLRLQKTHIQSAASAAVSAGIQIDRLTSLAALIEHETFRDILRHQWRKDGNKQSAYSHGLAVTLTAIATEWVKAPAPEIAALKVLRAKLGTLPTGLTPKNKAMLRAFDDPRTIAELIQLPDRLWHSARRGLATHRLPFISLQTALAIDLLIHVPLRMKNLTALSFEKHLHWPQGRRKPALVTFSAGETKNDVALEFEIPAALAERLWVYRHEIAPAVIGKRPDMVFVTFKGTARTQGAIKIAIEKAVLTHLGLKITPHQFRHLAAKIALDANPGSYEHVRQLLGQKNLKTTTNFYAGIDTRRAGRAHADLVMTLRDSRPARGPSKSKISGKKGTTGHDRI